MFIVIEIQKTNESSVSTLVNSYTNRNDAESKYHAILTAASVSTVYEHSAVMLKDDGGFIKNESYFHEPQQSE